MVLFCGTQNIFGHLILIWTWTEFKFISKLGYMFKFNKFFCQKNSIIFMNYFNLIDHELLD